MWTPSLHSRTAYLSGALIEDVLWVPMLVNMQWIFFLCEIRHLSYGLSNGPC